MRSKELFMLIDQIDKRFVEEAWEGDEEDGKVIEVVLERSPFHAIKFAVAVAACIVLFGAGFFTIANIRINEPFLPDNSGAAESPSFSSESEISSDTSSESNAINEISDAISDILNESTESPDVTDEPFDEFNKQGKYNLDLLIPYGETVVSEPVEKLDNEKYAVIYVDETSATEEHPLIVQIISTNSWEEGYVISEELYITGRGKYGFYYTELRGAGSICALYIVNDFKETHDDKLDIRIVGSWIP